MPANDKVNVCILDYGSGNVRSVYNIVRYLNYDVLISNKAEDIQAASHIILPGVGAFGSAIKKLKASIPLDVLQFQVLELNKPFLGICVGMQILADKGLEHGENQGLGWIKGSVEKLDSKGLSLPHIGWNEVGIRSNSPLFKNFSNMRDFYFVHSYVFNTLNKDNVVSETEYGSLFCSSVQRGNIFGVQFHPEKSQKAGQLLINNFLGTR